MLNLKFLCTGGSGFIGSHLVNQLSASGIELINIDIAEPKQEEHRKYWRDCNILDFNHLAEIFAKFQPTHVVHLAARTVMGGKSLADFRENTEGTANVLEVIKNTPSVSRVIITSSQHVRKPGSGLPQNDFDFIPHGLYGESKVITEKLTWEANLSCCWTIIRPTTVWGPLNSVLPNGLWKVMRKGYYFHPRNDPVVRSYGYIKNVIWQMSKILEAPEIMVNGKVYYVGEEPIKQIEWINAFSNALIGREVLQVPKFFIYLLALVGDALDCMGVKFPMDGPRFFNLTTSNPVSISPIIDAFGIPPYSMNNGVLETVRWLRENVWFE